MPLRILGIIVSIVGLAVVGIAISALSAANPLAPPGSVGDLRAQEWLLHWRVWSLSALVLGLLVICAGVGIVVRKPWSFVVLLCVALLLAVAPWVLSLTDYLLFPYEQPSWSESVLFLIVGLGALVGYFKLRRRSA